MVAKLEKVVYEAKARTTGGRRMGHAVTSDGQLDVKINAPKEMGGNGDGTNPEQLFAAGYSACFLGAVKFIAGQQKVTIPEDAAIDATIGFGPVGKGFGINAALVVHLPGLDRAVAQQLVDTAHQVCPYSNATRGNIEVSISLA